MLQETRREPSTPTKSAPGYMGHSLLHPTRSIRRVEPTCWPPAPGHHQAPWWAGSGSGWHIPDNGAVTFKPTTRSTPARKACTGLSTSVGTRTSGSTSAPSNSPQAPRSPCPTPRGATTASDSSDRRPLGRHRVSRPPPKPALSYVAFGGSYQAGEGLEPYYTNADNGHGGTYTNSCHRNPQAYPNLVFNDLKVAHPGNPELHFIACSGATTKEVLPTALGGGLEESYEVPQLDTGWLDANTTHVTIGIGGNDARFTAILFGCILPTQACTDPNYCLTVNSVVDPMPLVEWEPQVITLLSTPLGKILAQIRQLAPNAQVALVGYAHVITQDPAQRRFTVDCSLFSQADIDFFAQTGDQLNSMLAAAASKRGR